MASVNYLTRWRALIPKGPVGRSVALLAGTNGLAQMISLVTAPISTRLFSPADYGVAAVFTSVLAWLAVPSSGRYELAVPITADDDQALDVVILSLVALAGISGAALAAAVWSNELAAMLRTPGVRPYLWALPLGLLGGGVARVLSFWAVRQKAFRAIALAKLNQSLAGSLSSFAVRAFCSGPVGLIVAAVLSQTAGVVYLGRELLRSTRGRLPRVKWARLQKCAIQFREFPAMSVPAAMLNSACLCLVPLLLVRFYGEEVTGSYGLAWRFISLPMTLLGTAIAQVYLGEAAGLLRENPGALPALFSRVVRKLLGFGLLLMGLGALAPFAVPICFGKRWALAGIFAAALSVPAAAQIIVSPISNTAILMRRQDIQLLLDGLAAAVSLSSLYCAWALGASPTGALVAYALATAGLYGIYFLVYRRLALSAGSAAARTANAPRSARCSESVV